MVSEKTPQQTNYAHGNEVANELIKRRISDSPEDLIAQGYECKGGFSAMSSEQALKDDDVVNAIGNSATLNADVVVGPHPVLDSNLAIGVWVKELDKKV